VDRYVSGTNKPVPQFGVDDVAGGAKLARYVIDHFPNGAEIVFLTGEPGSSPAIDRSKGVRDTFKAAGDKYKIVADQTANFAWAQGLTVPQNILTSFGTPPDAIIASIDDMALAALEALNQLAKGRDGEMAATVEHRGCCWTPANRRCSRQGKALGREPIDRARTYYLTKTQTKPPKFPSRWIPEGRSICGEIHGRT
jgi:Periplasmic binding protein domain